MFYSHEILTSEKHGVATIWLVATLGPRATSKRITRKVILGVDVPRACDAIMNPEAPMALRLQGNLLYGVTRVYSRQCMYALTDVQSMLDRMKNALRITHGRGLDVDAGKAKPEELIVPYDPGFIPEISLPGPNLDLVQKDASIKIDLHQSSLLFSHFSTSSHSYTGLDPPQLDVSSSSLGVDDIGRFGLAGNNVSPTTGLQPTGDEGGVLLRPDFEFDEEGNIVDLAIGERSNLRPGDLSARDQGNDMGRARHQPDETAKRADDAVALDEDGILLVGESENPNQRQSPAPEGHLYDHDGGGGHAVSAPAPPTSAANRKIQRRLGVDALTQISNAELARWNEDYLTNMSNASEQRKHQRNASQAKKNALAWIIGRGIGSIGFGLGFFQTDHPLRSFCSDELLQALTGKDGRRSPDRKRCFDDVGSSEEDERRVRARREPELELARGDEVGLDYDEGLQQNEDVELGREAPASLQDDTSSQVPWNVTASLQSSLAGSSSVPHPFDNLDYHTRPAFGSLGRHGVRYPSSSPLARRSVPLDRLTYDRLNSLSLDHFENIDELGSSLDQDESVPDAGPGASAFAHVRGASRTGQPDIQDSMQEMSEPDRNFLHFVTQCIQADNQSVASKRRKADAIVFTRLLPPDSTSRSVATQALMHVLTLAMSGHVAVSQHVETDNPCTLGDVGDIHLTIPAAEP